MFPRPNSDPQRHDRGQQPHPHDPDPTQQLPAQNGVPPFGPWQPTAQQPAAQQPGSPYQPPFAHQGATAATAGTARRLDLGFWVGVLGLLAVIMLGMSAGLKGVVIAVALYMMLTALYQLVRGASWIAPLFDPTKRQAALGLPAGLALMVIGLMIPSPGVAAPAPVTSPRAVVASVSATPTPTPTATPTPTPTATPEFTPTPAPASEPAPAATATQEKTAPAATVPAKKEATKPAHTRTLEASVAPASSRSTTTQQFTQPTAAPRTTKEAAAPTKAPATTTAPRPVTSAPPAGGSTGGGGVTPGAFCSPEGASGTTSKGTPMRCSKEAGDARARWRSA